MNRNNISKFIGLLTLILFVASCANDGEEVAAIVDTNKPTMTTVVSSAITAAEGTEIPITFNLTAPVG